MMKKLGRRTLLNTTLTKKICALLHEGCDQRTACSICGIGERTFHEWKERGRNGEEPYASFFSAASRARDTHKARLVKIVIDAADKDARHAEWLLERGWPNEYGRATKPQPPQPEPQTSYLSDKELSEILDSIDTSQK